MNQLRFGFVFALVAVLLALGLPAKACSCYRGDPYEALENSDGAFIGEFISSREAEPPEPGEPISSARPLIYTFRVDEDVKGSFDETVDVEAPADGASCGLEVEPGQSYGLLLYGSEEGWSSNLCSQMEPDDLRAAARGLPAPDGAGPIKTLVGGSFSPANVIALDSQGRTLSYGNGEGDGLGLSVCEGSARFVQVVGDSQSSPRVVVRDTSSMDVLSEVGLPLAPGTGGQYFGGLQCRDGDASEVIVLSNNYNPKRPRSSIWSVRGQEVRKLYAGTAREGRFYEDRVYMREGKRGRILSYFDLETEARKRVARVTPRAGLSLSPDLTKVADVGGNSGRLTLADLTVKPPRVRQSVLGRGTDGDILWLDGRTLALVPGGYDNSNVELFDANLRVERTVPGEWYTLENVLVGDTAYGLGWGNLYRAQLPDGPAELLRRLPTEVTLSLAPVLDEVHAEGG